MEGYVVSYSTGQLGVPEDRVQDIRGRMKSRVPLHNFTVTLYFPPRPAVHNAADAPAASLASRDAAIPPLRAFHDDDRAATPYSMPASPSSRFLALSYAHTRAEDVVYAARDALQDTSGPPAASIRGAGVEAGSAVCTMRVSALGVASLDVDGDGLEVTDGHAVDTFTPAHRMYASTAGGVAKPSPRRVASLTDASTALRVADVYLRHHTFSGADEQYPRSTAGFRSLPPLVGRVNDDISVAHGGVWEVRVPEVAASGRSADVSAAAAHDSRRDAVVTSGSSEEEDEEVDEDRVAAALYAAHALPPFHLLDNLNGEGEDSASAAGVRHEFKYGVEVDDSDDGSGHASAVTAAHVWKAQMAPAGAAAPVAASSSGACVCTAPAASGGAQASHPRMRSRMALFTLDSISASLALSCNAHAVDAPPGEEGMYVGYLHAFTGVPVACDVEAHTYVEWTVQRSPAAYAHARSAGGMPLPLARLCVGVAPRASRTCVGACGHSVGLHSDGATLAGGIASSLTTARFGVGDTVGMCVQWLHLPEAPWGAVGDSCTAIVVFNINGRVAASVGPMFVPQGVELYPCASISSPGLRVRVRVSADECVHASSRVCTHTLPYPRGHTHVHALDGSVLIRPGGEPASSVGVSLAGVTLSDDAYAADHVLPQSQSKHHAALLARAWRDSRTFA